MRALSGKRYCIHVFAGDGRPVFYRLSDELVMDGVHLSIQSEDHGILIWAAPVPEHTWSPPYVLARAHERRVDSVHTDPTWFCRPIRGRRPSRAPVAAPSFIHAGHGNFIATSCTGHTVTIKRAGFGGEHGYRLALRDRSGTTIAEHALKNTAAAQGKQAAAALLPSWSEPTIEPVVKYRQVVLACTVCAQESYPRMTVDEYNAVARHKIRLIIPPCGRCGGLRALEPFQLVTSSGEIPTHHMPEMAPRRGVA